MCFSWSGGTRYVTELAVLLGLTDTRVTKTRTPGTKATGGDAGDALEPLDTIHAATFRSAVGLIGYIVPDRLDCQHAAKAVRSATRDPTKLDWMRMMRLAKIQVARSELGWLYQAQDVPEKYVVYGDSGWAGSETRRTTTGACEQFGQHPFEFSCSTQHVVALSSGEAELHATGPAAAGGLQSVQLLAEAGMNLKLEVLTDSTANLGMHNRIGSRRVRHLDVKWLWTHEAVQAGRFSLKKVGTQSNVSDLTTKHQDEERLKVLMRWAKRYHQWKKCESYPLEKTTASGTTYSSGAQKQAEDIVNVEYGTKFQMCRGLGQDRIQGGVSRLVESGHSVVLREPELESYIQNNFNEVLLS